MECGSTPLALPPALPSDYTYTPFYCEENIYLLANTFHESKTISQIWDIYIVFISNESKTVALWNQKRSKDLDQAVIWDYHCILVLRPRRGAATTTPSELTLAWVIDFDSHFAMPCRWSDYIQATFRVTSCESIPELYRCRFRVVPVSQFLDCFASDRSHMMKPPVSGCDTEYYKPPPTYPPIVGRTALHNGVSNNLMTSFVDMSTPPGSSEADLIGTVFRDVEFWEWGNGGQDES